MFEDGPTPTMACKKDGKTVYRTYVQVREDGRWVKKPRLERGELLMELALSDVPVIVDAGVR